MATDFDVIPALYLQTYLAFVRRTVIQKMLYPIVDHCASVFPSHTVIEILQSPGIWRWLSGFQFHMWVESVQIGDNLIRQRKNHWYQLFTYNLKRATLALSIPSLYHFHPLSNSGKSCSSQAVRVFPTQVSAKRSSICTISQEKTQANSQVFAFQFLLRCQTQSK